MTTKTDLGLKRLLQIQSNYAEQFKKNGLMELITGQNVSQKEIRQNLLDSIQTFSDYFQKTVMLRAIFTEHGKLAKMAQEHLAEEFGHNLSLLADRGNILPQFDPILDSSTSWFCWKMLCLNNLEKTVLMHWVLEFSAYLFFTEAHKVMNKYNETDYFKIHAEADEAHKDLDTAFLEGLREEEYENLSTVIEQGWKVLFVACDRIAQLSMRKVNFSNFHEKLLQTA